MGLFSGEKKVYIVYDDIRCPIEKWETIMENRTTEEVRWQVVKAMLDDFPSLKRKVKNYVEKN